MLSGSSTSGRDCSSCGYRNTFPLPPELPPDGPQQDGTARYGCEPGANSPGFVLPASRCGDTVTSVVNDRDIWRAANLLVRRHGRPYAAPAAARRAEELLAAGDVEGYAVWKRILSAATELTRTALAKGERVN